MKNNSTFVPSKADTTHTWATYFKLVGVLNNKDMSKDTSSYVLRNIKDISDTVTDKQKDGSLLIHVIWRRDTFYFAPYDSLVKLRDTIKKKDTIVSVKLFMNIPKEWILHDYNREVFPPIRK